MTAPPPAITQLNLESLREQVYQYLRREMQDGNLLPGATINISELSRRLGISKTPLRDALIYLEAEGFVSILPRRGVVVNKLTLEDVKNFVAIIGALEGAAIVAAVPRLTEKVINDLTNLNNKMITAVKREDFDEYYYLNENFHDVFLDFSENHQLRDLIKPYKMRLYDFPRRSYIKEWELINCGEHQEIVECLRAGDVAGAADVMRDSHWSFTKHEKFIRQFYFIARQEIEAELDRQRARNR
jgi:DNA-binding GntR family transcriptional regulator